MAPTRTARSEERVRSAPAPRHRAPPGAALLGLLAAPLASAAPVAEAWIALPADLDHADVLVRTGELRAGADGPEERVLVADPDALARLGLDVRELRADHRRGPPPPVYRGPSVGDAVLAELASRSPRAGLARLGTSVGGRPIEALWVGVPPDGGAPSFRVLGAHHGDEPISSELVLALAETLVARDGDDPLVTGLLDRSTVWLVPFVNPDGFVEGSRLDANGVDLNRNYDFGWRPDAALGGPEPFSEPEARAVRALGDLERTVLGITVHAGAANLGWPWNHTRDDPADAGLFEALADQYAGACDAPGFWVTQGGDWFRSNGDLDDWTYGRHGELELTLEVSVERAPDDPAEVVAQHLDAVLGLLALAPGLSGEVVDARSGLPVEATLVLDDGVPFRSDAATGAFHRLVPPGAGSLAVSAPGYAPVTVGAGMDLVVLLEPAGLAEGRVSPAVLRRPAPLVVPGGGPARLARPGAEPVDVEPGEVLDPRGLAPGWWTVELADGRVLPRAVFVDGPERGVAIERFTVDGGIACFEGVGFAHGARAWTVWGRERVPFELPVSALDEETLCVEVDAVPGEADPDVAVWTAGARLGVDHLWAPRELADPPSDEGLVAVGGCSCASIPGHRVGSMLSIVFGGWAVARSRRRGGRDVVARGARGVR